MRNDDPMVQIAQLGIGVQVELEKARVFMEQKKYLEMMDVLEQTVHRYPDTFEAWDALGSAEYGERSCRARNGR